MRFHCGISFSWKNIKKFLFPFLLGLLAYFGFNGFNFGFINAYAYTNQETSFNINMFDYKTYLENRVCGNTNLYDYINSLINSIDFSTSKYQIFITKPFGINTNDPLYLYTIDSTELNSTYGDYLWARGKLLSNKKYFELYSAIQHNGEFIFTFSNCPSNYDVLNSSVLQDLKNYIVNGDTSVYNDFDQYIGHFLTGTGYFDIQYQLSGNSTNTTTINNSSYSDIPLWYYYNSYDIYYPPYNIIQNSTAFWKTIHLVDEDYSFTYGDKFLGYYDFYYDSSISYDNNYSLGYKNRLDILYSNFSPNDLNNFNINLKFNTNINNINAYNYYQNIDFTNINCYGRINHNNNYYTYEKFSSCTFEIDNDNLDISSGNSLVDFNIYNLEIFDSNNNKITNFSNYDKLFYYISFQYNDDSLDLSVRNLEFNSNSNLLYSDFLRGEIFDSFYDLPIYSKLFFSNTGFSNDLASNVSAKTKKDLSNNSVFLYAQKYNLSTLETQEVNSFIASDSFQNLKVNSSNNIGYMIYNKTDNLNSPIINLKLDLILMRDIVISFNNISSNDFYYVDSNGDIINNTIQIDYSNGLTTDLNDLGGLLPPGPLDSLLNIPFYYTNKVVTSLNQKCEPWTFNFVFNKPFTMPCFDTFYEEFPPSVVVFLEVIPCAFLLISYFKHLYKKVDRATSLNTSSDDEWGVL